jgi:hypothetical protein
MDRGGADIFNQIKGTAERQSARFLADAVAVDGWAAHDLISFLIRGGRPRIRALTDWWTWESGHKGRNPIDIATDKHPEVALAKTLRLMKAEKKKA